MPNPNQSEANRDFHSKMDAITGKRGEAATDRAERIAGIKVNAAAAEKAMMAQIDEQWTAAPARQISNLGNIKGD